MEWEHANFNVEAHSENSTANISNEFIELIKKCSDVLCASHQRVLRCLKIASGVLSILLRGARCKHLQTTFLSFDFLSRTSENCRHQKSFLKRAGKFWVLKLNQTNKRNRKFQFSTEDFIVHRYSIATREQYRDARFWRGTHDKGYQLLVHTVRCQVEKSYGTTRLRSNIIVKLIATGITKQIPDFIEAQTTPNFALSQNNLTFRRRHNTQIGSAQKFFASIYSSLPPLRRRSLNPE